jgi:psp operon transcriptional activator
LAFSEALSRAAAVNRPVLIVGERGTGKELAAARLHYLSPRWKGPLVTLNCAALAPTLIESELFGHEAGAFTGADRRRPGRFEAAQGGTLFLDEIAGVPLTVQEKILPVEARVRIVGAANTDLRRLAQRGEFKQDLLDRLSFEVLAAPPLRERGDDVLLLANHFAARMAFELGRSQTPVISPQARDALMAHRWPGNVRELKNVVERAVYRTDADVIHDLDFDPFAGALAPEPPPEPASPDIRPASPAGPDPEAGLPFKKAVLRFEAGLLSRALGRTRYNQKAAARLLGLSYHQLRGLLRKHGGLEGLAADGGGRGGA